MKRWRVKYKKVGDNKVPVAYDLLIDGKLQGGVLFDPHAKCWVVDSYGFDRSWCGPVKSLEEGKAIVLSKS